MKNFPLLVMLAILAGCGNADNDSNMSVDTGDKPCPNQARADEMRINVVRSDAKHNNQVQTSVLNMQAAMKTWVAQSVPIISPK